MVSTVVSSIGLLYIYFNGTSYSSDFSGVYRTAYSARLNVTMQAEDMNASDPLPGYLAKAILFIMNPKSTAQPVPRDDQRTIIATTKEVSSDTIIQRGTETAKGQDN